MSIHKAARSSASNIQLLSNWRRTTECLPERGQIGIFNRSYYEKVLIVRVHPEILHAELLPPSLLDAQAVWQGRYRSIVDLENHLYRNGTVIIKFFLHLSAEEQRKRFLDRIMEPDKNWKFSMRTSRICAGSINILVASIWTPSAGRLSTALRTRSLPRAYQMQQSIDRWKWCGPSSGNV